MGGGQALSRTSPAVLDNVADRNTNIWSVGEYESPEAQTSWSSFVIIFRGVEVVLIDRWAVQWVNQQVKLCFAPPKCCFQNAGPGLCVSDSHPEGAVVGGAEHFGLVRRGDDGQRVDGAHVARQGPHLLFGLNVPHLQRKYMSVTCLEGASSLHRRRLLRFKHSALLKGSSRTER